jgi:hypothetical protein
MAQVSTIIVYYVLKVIKVLGKTLFFGIQDSYTLEEKQILKG